MQARYRGFKEDLRSVGFRLFLIFAVVYVLWNIFLR